MPAVNKKPRLHRLQTREDSFTPVNLETLEVGDVFVRQGTACMLAAVNPAPPLLADGLLPIINLISGAVWWVSGKEQVHPGYDVRLEFRSARRQD